MVNELHFYNLNCNLDDTNKTWTILGETISTYAENIEIDSLANYKSIVVLIYYGETEYFAVMNIPISLFKAEPIAPFYPSYHNEIDFYKGRISYIDDTHISLTAPTLHGIRVVGVK